MSRRDFYLLLFGMQIVLWGTVFAGVAFMSGCAPTCQQRGAP